MAFRFTVFYETGDFRHDSAIDESIMALAAPKVSLLLYSRAPFPRKTIVPFANPPMGAVNFWVFMMA